MPVALEFINILVRKDAIETKYPGGWSSFLKSNLHNPSIGWYDNFIYRTGTMSSTDTERLVKEFEKIGFVTHRVKQEGLAERSDLCVWDSIFGPSTECDWIDFKHNRNNSRVVRFRGDKSTKIADRNQKDATSTPLSTILRRAVLPLAVLPGATATLGVLLLESFFFGKLPTLLHLAFLSLSMSIGGAITALATLALEPRRKTTFALIFAAIWFCILFVVFIILFTRPGILGNTSLWIITIKAALLSLSALIGGLLIVWLHHHRTPTQSN